MSARPGPVLERPVSRYDRRVGGEVPILAAGDECAYLFAAKFVPFQAQPRFSLSHDLSFYQGRTVGAIRRNDQLHM